MQFIRQGATHKVTLGPAVAVGDGFTPVTNLTLSGADEAEVILHDNGTVVDISGYTWDAITTADGYYHLTLQSGISNTVGHMTVVVNDDSLVLPLRADFCVVEEAVYDQLFAGSAPGAATPTALATAQSDLDTLTGSDGVTLATSQPNYAPATAAGLATAQADLDTITGSDGVTLATTQGNYAPSKAGDQMALVDDAIAAGKFDQTTAFPMTAADGSDLTEVGGDGAQLTEAGGTGDHLTALASAANLALVKAVTDALTAAAAAKLATSAGTILTGTISDANTTPTTTVFAADDITEATADHYIGRIIIFTSGALTGQATDITDYALDTSEGKFTVSTMTEAPANNDEFVII